MKISRAVAAIAAFSLGAISANAAIIASTNFDGRTLTTTTNANDTATGASLAWTTNGVTNPGSMVSLNASGAGLELFNNTTLTQNMFAPLINTGNGDTFWTTNVSLTVSPGNTVTLTDVTFNNWSINSGGAANNDRASDFTVSLISPLAVTIATVNITDSAFFTATGSPLVTATFSSAMELSAPGTYTLRIKGGDFVGVGINASGNHTAIDNLSINGTVVPEPSAALLGGLGLLALLRRRRR